MEFLPGGPKSSRFLAKIKLTQIKLSQVNIAEINMTMTGKTRYKVGPLASQQEAIVKKIDSIYQTAPYFTFPIMSFEYVNLTHH